MFRWLPVVVVAVFAFLCACPPQPPVAPDAGTPRIELLNLPETLNVADDDAINTPGLQLRVRAALVDADGTGCTQIEIANAASGDRGRVSVDAQNEVAVVIDFVTAPGAGASNQITAACVNGAGVAEASGEVFAIDDDGGDASARCIIEAPNEGATINGASTGVSVRCVGDGDLADAQRALVTTGIVLVTAAGPAGASFTAEIQLTSDTATAAVDGTGAATLQFAANGRHELSAALVDVNAVFTPPARGDLVAVNVTLPPAQPCEITRPTEDQLLDADDDLDNNPLNGVTTRLQGSCPDDGNGAFTITCTNAGGGQQIVNGDLLFTEADGAFTFDQTIRDLVNPTCTAVVQVDGLPDARRDFLVDADAPVIDVVIDPDDDDDAFYERDDDRDGNSAGTLEVDVAITPTLPSGTWTGVVTVSDEDGATVFGPQSTALTSGVESNVTVSLPVADDALFTVSVFATLDDCVDPDPCDSATFSDLARVDTVAPDASITFPTEALVLNASADVEAARDGLQIDVVITEASLPSNAHTCAIVLDDAALPECAVVANVCTSRVTIGDGAHVLSAVCEDEAGNATAVDGVSFSSDATPPALTLAGLSAVTTASDEDLIATGVQETYTVDFEGIDAPAIIRLLSDVEGVIGEASVNTASGSAAIEATFIFEGAHVISAAATDDAGNAGTSNALGVTATTDLFFVAITNPELVDNVRLITAADDTDANSAGAQVAVSGTTQAPAGSTVTVLVNGLPRGAPGTVDANGAFVVTVTFNDAENGTLEVTVSNALEQGSSGVDQFVVDL